MSQRAHGPKPAIAGEPRRGPPGWWRLAGRLIRTVAVAGGAWALLLFSVRAVTLKELLNEPRMTPKSFADYFASFDFVPHDEVQLPDVFLRTKKGDCDDYAILADYVLSRRAYHTRLIFIRLVGRGNHAVCYVDQSRAYLDYNNRIFFVTLERCGPTLREIGDHVGDYIQANWTSVSQFTYTYEEDRKHFIMTVVKTDPPASDADHYLDYAMWSR